MVKEEKKTKIDPVPKKDGSPENKSTKGRDASKADDGETTAASPSGYNRGEGQKPVSKAYRDNWNVIFAKKNDKSRDGACLRT